MSVLGAGRVVFDNHAPHNVAHCEHDKGMQYHFSDDKSLEVPWCWQEMIAQLDALSLRHVVEGVDPTNHSGGVTGCVLLKTSTYDHKRHYAKNDAAKKDAASAAAAAAAAAAAVAANGVGPQSREVIADHVGHATQITQVLSSVPKRVSRSTWVLPVRRKYQEQC